MHKFSLETVLKHRIHLEESLQKELSTLKRLLSEEKNKLDELKKEREHILNELENKQKHVTTISEGLLYIRFIELLANRHEKQKHVVFDLERNVERKRDDLLNAAKNRKSMEKLKETKMERYNDVLLKKEHQFMNEMANVRFKRNMRQA